MEFKKKIWIDIEEPKTGIMFKPLIEKFHQNNFETFITARDYDSTYQILDEFGLKYEKVGQHGGENLEDKLKAYIDRLGSLINQVLAFKPDFLVTFSSVEGARISYGLNIPSIGYNDEPRNIPVCKLIFPYLDKIIVPQCVPKDWYIKLHADPEKLIPYNGIDEIAWLSEYKPNPDILGKHDLKKGEYVILRTEPSFASYFIDKLDPYKTIISEFLPDLFKKFPNQKYIIIVRTKKQETYLKRKMKSYLQEKNLILTRFMPSMVDLCFYASLVISGGGTIVRESSLLGVPSIEFFPGETAPQEHFLMNNGFPLIHIKEKTQILEHSMEILRKGPASDRFSLSFKEKLKAFENPNEICFNLVNSKLSGL
jgi:predicted glycosyltransferase